MTRFILVYLCLVVGVLEAVAQPRVIASIMPVHSIVSAVMGDTGKPQLLLPGRQSEHTSSLSPRQLVALSQADLVFIVSARLEFKLGQLSGSEAVGGKRFVELGEAADIRRHSVREGGAWAEHEEHEEEGEHVAVDPHVWLDPGNAKAMALAVARELAAIDAPNAAIYAANAAGFAASIDTLTAELRSQLDPVKARPFIVFHDAYQYFERYFGLNAVGSIADLRAASPSAKRLQDIRGRLKESGAVCVFREPQFDAKFAQVVIEDSNAKLGVLDPLGADLAEGPKAYIDILRNLATSLRACLE